ncbi:MAG: hypothetical protein ACYCQJ_07925 [Nitrososphaerales archaeon]
MSETIQESIETQKQEEDNLGSGMITPFCEANLNFVHNELLYILHPRMQVGDTVYIENAP